MGSLQKLLKNKKKGVRKVLAPNEYGKAVILIERKDFAKILGNLTKTHLQAVCTDCTQNDPQQCVCICNSCKAVKAIFSNL